MAPSIRLLRLAATGLSAALLISSCSSPGSTDDPDTGGVYSVTHEAGTTDDVPVNPGTIVVLDEYAALNMLEIGVTPDVVFGGLSSQVGAMILAEEGVELVPAPTMITEPDFETIAARNPDLIVLTTPGTTIEQTYPRFSQIAPTIVLPYEKPWREMLTITGAAFQREKEATKVANALQSKLDKVVSASRGNPGSVALLGSFRGSYFSVAMVNPLSITLKTIGFTRPAAESEGVPAGASTSAVMFSPERLGDHSADAIVVLNESIYDGAAVRALPTFASLPAAKNNRVFTANGELWLANFGLGTWWLLEDVQTLLVSDTGTTLGSIDNAVERWNQFTAAIG